MAKRKKQVKEVHDSRIAGQAAATAATLLEDPRGLIRQKGEGVAQTVNSAFVFLYRQAGQRVYVDILPQKRAG